MRAKQILIASVLLAQQAMWPMALATAAPPQSKPSTFVMPSEVSAKEPFTFAVGAVEGEVVAGGTLEGEVVTVATVEGEVVQKEKTDKYGRVFLATGLAAGMYMISRTRNSKASVPITIKPPRNLPDASPLKIDDTPKTIGIAKGLSLNGQGFSPNADAMVVTIGNKQVPVLAATASELRTGPLPVSLCGHAEVKVRNAKTGESVQIPGVTVFSLKAKLSRQKLTNGEQSSLEFTFLPEDTRATVNVHIVSGPVTFTGGKTETQVVIQHGKATVPLVADPAGLGTFRVAYDLEKVGD